MSSDATELEAWYSNLDDVIRVGNGSITNRYVVDMNIRDAVFLRYQLDGAIADYERAVGRP